MVVLTASVERFSVSRMLNFHQLGPLGRVGLVVDMCVCFSVSLMSPFHVIFVRGRTGAERASGVDWCKLHLDLE